MTGAPGMICQSCGMPMTDSDFGTNANGSKNREFCHFCYGKGRFVDEGITMEAKILKNIEIAKQMGMSETQAKQMAWSTIPNLKRWKK